jgi:hypothetical protein
MPVSCLLSRNLVIVFTLLVFYVATLILPNYRSSDVGFVFRFYIVSASPAILFVCTGLEIWKLKFSVKCFPYSSFSEMRNKFIHMVLFMHRV